MDRDTTYHSTKRLGPQTSINYSSRRWYPLVLLLVIIISFCLTYIAYPSLLTINLVDDYLDSYANNKIAIVVLGGGLLPNGDVPPHTQLRIDEAVNIYHSLHAASGAGSATAPSLPIDIITLSGGTPHKPNPVDNHGFPIWESSAAAKKLLEKNIPIENVLEESSSLDTVGNVRWKQLIISLLLNELIIPSYFLLTLGVFPTHGSYPTRRIQRALYYNKQLAYGSHQGYLRSRVFLACNK